MRKTRLGCTTAKGIADVCTSMSDETRCLRSETWGAQLCGRGQTWATRPKQAPKPANRPGGLADYRTGCSGIAYRRYGNK